MVVCRLGTLCSGGLVSEDDEHEVGIWFDEADDSEEEVDEDVIDETEQIDELDDELANCFSCWAYWPFSWLGLGRIVPTLSLANGSIDSVDELLLTEHCSAS